MNLAIDADNLRIRRRTFLESNTSRKIINYKKSATSFALLRMNQMYKNHYTIYNGNFKSASVSNGPAFVSHVCFMALSIFRKRKRRPIVELQG